MGDTQDGESISSHVSSTSSFFSFFFGLRPLQRENLWLCPSDSSVHSTDALVVVLWGFEGTLQSKGAVPVLTILAGSCE